MIRKIVAVYLEKCFLNKAANYKLKHNKRYIYGIDIVTTYLQFFAKLKKKKLNNTRINTSYGLIKDRSSVTLFLQFLQFCYYNVSRTLQNRFKCEI